jgi:sugar transferase (PEP-CTERM/EpsH1 system associated)
MRILLLTHRMPYPPNKGDKIRSFNILNYLAKRHEVYVASPVDDARDLRYAAELQARVHGFLYERIDGRMRVISAARALQRSESVTVTHFYSRSLQQKIDELIGRVGIDAFFCFSSPMAEYLFRSGHADGSVARAVRVMDLIDVDSYKWSQYADESPAWRAWLYRFEARHLAAYERRIARSFDRVLVSSEQEKVYFPGGADTPNLSAMSNGVDLEFFSPHRAQRSAPSEPVLVFTGVMDYRPNIDGIKWFVERVYPRILAAVPGVRLFIVGSQPTAAVRRLGKQSGVVVTGFVTDIRDYLARASVCIVPLRIARGIQNKVLEAMAMGKPVVCTTQAHEGIRAEAGREIVVADGEEAFAAAVIELLSHPAGAQRLGSNARLCVERGYSWQQNLEVLDAIFREGGANRPTGPDASGTFGQRCNLR